MFVARARPSIVLGTEAVTPLEVADAYATFAAEGIRHVPQAIQKVVFSNGRVEHTKVQGKRVVPAGVAYVVDRGNNRIVKLATRPRLQKGDQGVR